jgi:hypothetical protein
MLQVCPMFISGKNGLKVKLSSFSGTSTSFTFESSTVFAAIVFCSYDEQLNSWPTQTCTVNGTSATSQVFARFSDEYQEGTRTFTIANPTSGTIAFGNTGDGPPSVSGFVFEFSREPTVNGTTATANLNRLGSSSASVQTPGISVGSNTVVVWAAVIGDGRGDYITNFNGAAFAAVPTSPSSVYYGSAAGYSVHTSSETISRTWTMNSAQTHYNYLTGLRLDF